MRIKHHGSEPMRGMVAEQETPQHEEYGYPAVETDFHPEFNRA